MIRRAGRGNGSGVSPISPSLGLNRIPMRSSLFRPQQEPLLLSIRAKSRLSGKPRKKPLVNRQARADTVECVQLKQRKQDAGGD